MKNKKVCVVGLGYVGLPLPKAFMVENKSVKSVLYSTPVKMTLFISRALVHIYIYSVAF